MDANSTSCSVKFTMVVVVCSVEATLATFVITFGKSTGDVDCCVPDACCDVVPDDVVYGV